MQPFAFHVLVCEQKKPEWAPSCTAGGAAETLDALKEGLREAGLDERVLVTSCGCLGLCDDGPNLVVYPDGTWYSKVTPEAARKIVTEHLGEGKPVEELARKDAGATRGLIKEHFNKVRAVKQAMEKGGMMPDQVNNLMRGFMESRAMLTAIELDAFTAVGDGAEAQEVAKRLGTAPRATESLLNAVAALGMLKKQGDRFYNTEVADKWLRKESPDYSRTALMHIVNLWPRWSTLTDCLKAGSSVSLDQPRDAERTRNFIAAMHRNASFRAPQVVGALDLTGVKRVLDLGGGSGAYSMAFVNREPELEVTLFDLPSVTSLAEEYIAREWLQESIRIMKGDMLKDDLGVDYDMVFLSAITHMWSPEENLDLFKRCRHALAPGGRIVIQDFVMEDDKTRPRFGALFALNMLVNTRGGGTYNRTEYCDWLAEAGFQNARIIPLPGPTDLVEAKKPKVE